MCSFLLVLAAAFTLMVVAASIAVDELVVMALPFKSDISTILYLCGRTVVIAVAFRVLLL